MYINKLWNYVIPCARKKTSPSLEPSIQTNRENGLFSLLYHILDMFTSLSNAEPCSSRVNEFPDRPIPYGRGNLIILKISLGQRSSTMTFSEKDNAIRQSYQEWLETGWTGKNSRASHKKGESPLTQPSRVFSAHTALLRAPSSCCEPPYLVPI